MCERRLVDDKTGAEILLHGEVLAVVTESGWGWMHEEKNPPFRRKVRKIKHSRGVEMVQDFTAWYAKNGLKKK